MRTSLQNAKHKTQKQKQTKHTMASYFDEHDCDDEKKEQEEQQQQQQQANNLMQLFASLNQQQQQQQGGTTLIDSDTLRQLGIRQGVPPISAAELRNRPIIFLTKQNLLHLKSKGHEECSICTENFKLDEKCFDLECKHYFHDKCLINWWKKSATCPLCRSEFQTDDPEYEESKLDKNRHKDTIHSMYM